MLFIWGNKGYLNHLGYIVYQCPSCEKVNPFSAYQVGKKFTVYFIPTFSYSEQYVLECGACTVKFEVSAEMKEKLKSSLMSQEQLSQFIRRLSEDRARQQAAALAQQTQIAAATKACPYCAEQIQAAAIYCRFCQHDLK